MVIFKRMFYVLLISIIVALSGCSSNYYYDSPDTAVSVSGHNTFPKELVGLWVSDREGWVIRVDEDGAIRKITHTMGRVNLNAGQVAKFPLKNQGEGIVKPGKWFLQYDAVNRELAIDITLDYFDWEMGEQIVEGSSRDIFIGVVSDDMNTWSPQWDTFPEYIVSTDKVKDYQLPLDDGITNLGVLQFTKQDFSDLEK